MAKIHVEKKNKIKENRVFMTVDYVIMTLFSLICIIPLINILALSFSSPNIPVMLLPKGFEFYSYAHVLQSVEFYRSFGVSLIITVVGTIGSVLILALASYPLSKEHFPFRRGFMLFFIIIMLFSGGIVPNFIWYKMIGMIDSVAVLILPNIVSVFNLILIKSYFEGLPESVEEAAKIDGAGNVRILFSIVLPMCVPILITVGLFTVVAFWNNYQSALYYLPTNTKLYPLAMYILNFTQSSAVDSIFADPNRAAHKSNIEAAMIVISIIPIVAAYPFFLKYFTSGITLGAVKA